MRLKWVVLAVLAVLGGGALLGGRAACSHGGTAGRPRTEADLSALPETPPVQASRVVLIDKSARALGLYIDGERVSAYGIGLGRQPEGTKLRQGDRRTPEGEYFICTRNARSRFHLFLGISYPGIQDAERAEEEGLISQRELAAVTEAIEARRQPPWNTALGGAIGIHGNGSYGDWTLGCIALDDEAVEKLWAVLKVGDPVVIVP